MPHWVLGWLPRSKTAPVVDWERFCLPVSRCPSLFHTHVVLMKIILAEQRPGEQAAEQSFDQAVVLIGRDANECDIAFDNTQFPMVSRKHAELRWQDGKWIIVDLNSSYGTLLNGQKLGQPAALSVGSTIQFGMQGPMIRVVWFEVSETLFDIAPAAPAAASPIDAAQESTAKPSRPLAPAQLDFLQSAGQPPHKITKHSVWLGREAECDIVFEASAAMVSRKHAEIRIENGEYILADNKSFNGTLVNQQRISTPVPLYHNDEIQLGLGGPVLRFNSPGRIAPVGASLAGQRAASHASEQISSKTMVFKPDSGRDSAAAQPQLLMSLSFGDKHELTIGRDEKSDIRLDGLQISKNHARLLRSQSDVVIDDLNSTNGVYVNGSRTSRQSIGPNDSTHIGTFLLKIAPTGEVGVFDTRSKTRIDAVNLTKEVRSRFGGGRVKLLDGISLSIQPNEFVGLLGPSGAGKSMLIEAMNGVRPASSGNVFVNNLDLYRHLDSLKQAIGYVPQDDIIHRELSVYRTLYYVAKLRLSRDVTSSEIDQIINEVLDVTGLSERRNVHVSQLSGGQRKRVSIAVELITKPSVIFLDEPTSGLDPATEEKVMKLFHQIAESGRTVIMTTHAMENIRLFDKIVVLMRGKLVFFGNPEDALKHLQAESFKQLYDRLEQPVDHGVREHGEANRVRITEQTAEEWKQKFLATPQYAKLIEEPLKELDQPKDTARRKKRRLGIFGAIGQWLTLSRRYLEVLLKDKLNLFILFAQAPIIALLTFLVMGANQPRDFVYFVVALVAFWFGTSVAAREVIREKAVYKRERMFNLGILPYLSSKLFVLGIIVGLQCLLLFVPLKLFHVVGLMPMPGELGGLPQFTAMLLTAGIGIALGLLVSALVRTPEMATSLVPLILIPQILFSGLVGVPSGLNKVIGLTMPAAWSFDTMKRFSTLDTLEPEGSNPRGKHKGLGLYKSIESENEKMIAQAKKDFEDYKKAIGGQFQEDQSGSTNLSTETPGVGTVKKIPENRSGYITFLHPWMNEVLNQIVLMLMFGILVIATLIVLRLKDIN